MISTRLGNFIPHYIPLKDWNKKQKKSLIRNIKKYSPYVIVRREPSTLYNCHGLTFANRRAWIANLTERDLMTNQLITSTEILEGIMIDDGYISIDIKKVEIGDLAVYREYQDGEIYHTGMVMKVDSPFGQTTNEVFLIMSKWGENGEFLHTPFDVPRVYGDYIQYWTERK